MTVSCPYCGSRLNIGLKFCVVCGRQASPTEMAKLKDGKLKSSARQGGMTKRLDDSIGSAKFFLSKRSYQFQRYLHYFIMNCIYIGIAVALFYCAIRFTVELASKGRIHRVVSPFINRAAPATNSTAKQPYLNHAKKRVHNRGTHISGKT